MTKIDQRIMLTKRLLLEALMSMLERQPMADIRVTDLCREAGINRATFYRHYAIPQDVLEEAADELIRDLDRLARPLTSAADLEQALERMCTYLLEHKRFVTTLIRCRSDDGVARIFSDMSLESQTWLRESQKRSGMDEDSFRLSCIFLLSGVYSVVREWLFGDIDKTPAQIARLVMGLLDKSSL